MGKVKAVMAVSSAAVRSMTYVLVAPRSEWEI